VTNLDTPLAYSSSEIGCGDGRIVGLAQELGWKAEALAFDPDTAATAVRRNLKVQCGRQKTRTIPDNSFDLILVKHVIEHLQDPMGSLNEIRRILRPDGSLILTSPNASGGGHRHFAAEWVHLDPPRHLAPFCDDHF
jgi:SAM-dependent methyltransferase